MDRNELILRMEALKAAMHQHDYEKAAEIADELELRKIRDNNFLSLVADAYELNHDYDKSKDALLTAYENTNAGRQLAYRLCLISIKTKEYNEAEEFYEDFVEMAPRDTSRYILKYKMAKAKGDSTEKLIGILEEYVNLDMEEKWAYELAKLYHLAGDQEKCVDMCDEISLWFSEGKYVLKALELKKTYVPLSSSQEQKYEEGKKRKLEEALEAEEEIKVREETIPEEEPEDIKEEQEEPEDIEEEQKNTEEEPEDIEEESEIILSEEDGDQDIPEIFIKDVEESTFDTVNIQEVIAQGMKDVDFDEANIHEGPESTKVADGKISSHIESPEEDLEKLPEEVPVEPIKSLEDVQDILKQLQDRGILKAETVQQAVTIIEEAGNEENVELDKELAKIDEGIDEEEETPDGSNEQELEPEENRDDQRDDAEEKSEDSDTTDEVKENVQATIVIPDLDSIVKSEEEAPVKPAESVDIPVNTGNIPVLDLGFDSPKRDTSNDIGQENMYENIVANSDLGNITDKIPSKEEIEQAIKEAEQSNNNPETDEKEKESEELRSTKNLSAAVEVIAGTEWSQEQQESNIS